MKKIILFVIAYALNGCGEVAKEQTGRGKAPADTTEKRGVNGPNADSVQHSGFPKGDLK